ncbi:MAG: SPOR domain-containing protein [Rhodospirillales bacterium]
MPKNEEGEFELVVGNRQLLTIVFIMMVLFGVVFTMGYLVGRTASPTEGPPAMAAVKGQPADTAAQRPGPSQPLPAPESTAAPEAPPEGETKTPVGTVPVGGAAAGVTEPPAPQPVQAAQKPAGPLPPAPGQTFLQVGAVKRPEAEVIVDVLKKRGFSAQVAPVVAGQPDDALWRVLVGPVPDAATLAKTRADLQNAGFPVIVRKY